MLMNLKIGYEYGILIKRLKLLPTNIVILAKCINFLFNYIEVFFLICGNRKFFGNSIHNI